MTEMSTSEMFLEVQHNKLPRVAHRTHSYNSATQEKVAYIGNNVIFQLCYLKKVSKKIKLPRTIDLLLSKRISYLTEKN